MPTPPTAIIQLLSVFGVAFSVRSFAKAQVLLFGAILAPGPRTVTAALRAVGLGHAAHFSNYHRVLNRDHWSPWLLSRLLLGLIVSHCLGPDDPLLLIVDETLERRCGRRIRIKGWYHDAVRSTVPSSNIAQGIRWQCLAILVSVPWSTRAWALPFMTIPALSGKVSTRLDKPPHPTPEWAGILVARVRRWYPDREIVLVGDGAYAAVALVTHCQQLAHPVRFISRLRLDARLYDPPQVVPGRRGRKPQKGALQPALRDRLADPLTVWQRCTVPWYGGTQQTLDYCTATALWYRQGRAPVPIRWVLVRAAAPQERRARFRPTAFFASDPSLTAERIIALYVARWNIEVTFEELRGQLGFETQRQWSERAIERTTPCLFGLFSLVVLMAQTLHPTTIPVRQTTWYVKEEATFADVLAAVRRDLWGLPNYDMSSIEDDMLQLPWDLVFTLFERACYAT